MPTFAVTGASGHLGRQVVEHLLERDVAAGEIVAVVRTPEKVADLAVRGVVVREGDYSRPGTLASALAGVRTLLLVSGNEVGRRVEQHTAVIEAARDAGVRRVLYTSILKADTTANPIAPEHQGTEKALRASGVPFTLLRNGWYTENYSDRLAEYAERGEILSATGTGRVSAATRDDFAAAAAAAMLRDDDADDAVYELGGPAFDFDELAAAVTEVTGRAVVHRALPAAELAEVLQGAGLDAGTAGFVAALDESIARGELETGSDDLDRLLGRPATPLREALRAARS
jgi:NAD(P)H dehydrogenase (quinone)